MVVEAVSTRVLVLGLGRHRHSLPHTLALLLGVLMVVVVACLRAVVGYAVGRVLPTLLPSQPPPLPSPATLCLSSGCVSAWRRGTNRGCSCSFRF